MVYRKRPDVMVDKRPLLDAMGRCRSALARAKSEVRISGPLYLAIGVVMSTIDGVAEILTGDRTFYHAGGSAHVTNDGKWRDSGR